MGRYRAPQKPGSPYITREGVETLRSELAHLWQVKRPEVTARVSAAAAEGDRSENAEYIYSKKQLREIDRRVRFLRKRLEVLQVVENMPKDSSRAYFGAWVTLANDAGETVTYRIVGPDEFDLSRGYISMDAPMAKAIMHKQEGDEVVVRKPQGERVYDVLKIRYQDK